MIPARIIQYLHEHDVSFERRPHARAITAQELAAALHVTGYRVAKSVLVEADGRPLIALLPAPESVDQGRLARAVGARNVRLLRESEFAGLFPDCELGAEPPFGRLYGLPVAVERALARVERVLFRAGSHEEAIELAYDDFVRLERPLVGDFGALPDLFPGAPLETRP